MISSKQNKQTIKQSNKQTKHKNRGIKEESHQKTNSSPLSKMKRSRNANGAAKTSIQKQRMKKIAMNFVKPPMGNWTSPYKRIAMKLVKPTKEKRVSAYQRAKNLLLPMKRYIDPTSRYN